MREALEESVIAQGKPFFGICVGMQMMADRGLEHGDHQGLGWISGEVVHITHRQKPENSAYGLEHAEPHH